jgi:hypothetical protein
MKGIVFTLDALFALMITLASISVLLFFTYYAQTPYALSYSNVQTLMSNFASTSVVSLQNSSSLALSMARQYLGANETSPQFLGGPQDNSSNQVGPLYPILDFVYRPGNTITTSVIADYGNIYFAANSILYAVNASTNRTVWTRNTVTSVVTTPAAYSGTLLYATPKDLDAVSALTGALVWTTNTAVYASYAAPNTALTAYDNLVIFGSGTTLYAYYANNGTPAWSTSTTDYAKSILDLKGNLEVGSEQNNAWPIVNIRSVLTAPGSANELTYTNPGGGITGLAGSGTNVYFGSAVSPNPTANAINLDGTTPPGFPVTLLSPTFFTGVAVYKNYIIYQSSNSVLALSPSGSVYWARGMPASFGVIKSASGLINATPAVSGTTVYTLWPNGLAAQNLTSGSVLWFALMPSANVMPYMTLSYGRLYVIANNAIRVYGSCYSPLHATLLSAAATMYWNSQPGCASALLNSVYPLANYSLFVGNTIPGLATVASFNGMQGYVSAKNNGALNSSSYVSASFWINISAVPASTIRVVNYGDNSNCLSPTPECGWFFSLTNTGTIQFNVMYGSTQTSVTSVPLASKKWYLVTGVYNGTNTNLYISANTPSTASFSGVISPTTPNINLTIGGMPPSWGGAYFTGNLANLQVYSDPFNQQQVSQLYREGIEGVPINNYGLVAWYPFAGDANDYSLFNSGFVTGGVNFIKIPYASPEFSNAYEVSKASTLLPVLNYSTGSNNSVQVGVLTWS